MKILYGVQGTGNGHIARARIMAAAFAHRDDVQVDFIFTGREADKYFDMHVFGDYQTRQGLTFFYENGRINQFKTVREANIGQLVRDIRALDVSDYDLHINDFEPVTAWACKRAGVPSISISHQAAFTYDVPKKGESWLDTVLTKYFAPCQTELGVHWYHFGQRILPPFISEQPKALPSNAHILVYLPFESIAQINELLEPFSEQRFVCFHPDVSATYQHEHIHYNPTAKAPFREALLDAQGVIANGGFELSSEALRLGKKLLIKPLQGQYEQLSNAHTLELLGLADVMMSLNGEVLDDWLKRPANEEIVFPHDPNPFIDWLIAGDWSNPQVICDQIWQQVNFPPAVQERLISLA